MNSINSNQSCGFTPKSYICWISSKTWSSVSFSIRNGICMGGRSNLHGNDRSSRARPQPQPHACTGSERRMGIQRRHMGIQRRHMGIQHRHMGIRRSTELGRPQHQRLVEQRQWRRPQRHACTCICRSMSMGGSIRGICSRTWHRPQVQPWRRRERELRREPASGYMMNERTELKLGRLTKSFMLLVVLCCELN